MKAFNTVSEKETLLCIQTRDNSKRKAGLVTFQNNKVKPKGKNKYLAHRSAY